MLKGINQWCYPEGTPLEKVFEYSHNAHFDAVELNLNPDDGVGLTLSTTEDEAKLILELAHSYNLKLRSISTGLLWKMPLSHPDAVIREKGRRVIEKQMELASVIGMDTVLVVPGIVTEETSYLECYTRSQEELSKLIPLAQTLNINIGIENVWNKFLMSPLEMRRYIDELNSDYIGAYFDVGNVLQFGYPEQWITTLGQRIKKIHVKDFNVAVGNINGFVPLLAGDVNWKKVFIALEQIGYDDVVTSEITPYTLDPRLLANDTSRHMDELFSLGNKVRN
ncbi:sugar phosphate isomerase/epimerase family protein [Aquibacillus salsiterrae]|uniref:Sugar phosphate isomerase/epimerase n=1 Tax=Aquibacillus salsiterrae TaxID=2950439 RepID=A0A9X3WCV9_9BACI|nr:sugar phosphate isomerase/epimerase family protein [Aquibacillus salsiterrae]MDC3417530.1 sugar phosphate isomerase/epimerase [Aquibacillus salsiterrae]